MSKDTQATSINSVVRVLALHARSHRRTSYIEDYMQRIDLNNGWYVIKYDRDMNYDLKKSGTTYLSKKSMKEIREYLELRDVWRKK